MIGEPSKPDGSPVGEDAETFHISHQRDLVIYRAYCAVKCVMDAMVFAAEMDALDAPRRLKSSVSVCETPRSDLQGSSSGCRLLSRSVSGQSGGHTGSEVFRSRSVSLRSTDSSVINEIAAYREAYQEMYTK